MAAALGWGVVSVLLSPCHLAGIPLIIGYVASSDSLLSPWRAFSLSLAFAVGHSAVIMAGVYLVYQA
ncbi:MAG: hypothetical protein ACN0LA_06335 [Candidatus Longimicrobiales bacterium M2_2A_002]